MPLGGVGGGGEEPDTTEEGTGKIECDMKLYVSEDKRLGFSRLRLLVDVSMSLKFVFSKRSGDLEPFELMDKFSNDAARRVGGSGDELLDCSSGTGVNLDTQITEPTSEGVDVLLLSSSRSYSVMSPIRKPFLSIDT